MAPPTSSGSSTASGQQAGMPLYLNQAPTVTMEPEIDAGIEDELSGMADEAPEEQAVQAMTEGGEEPAGDLQQAPEQIPDVSGTGVDVQVSAHSLSLEGLTEADYSSSFRASNLRTAAATGCETCDDSECVHVTGTLISTFSVTTTVTLPSVSDFPDLTACQRRRVRDAITNVLAPHERRHVTAFRTYNGVVRTPSIDLRTVSTPAQALHDSVEARAGRSPGPQRRLDVRVQRRHGLRLDPAPPTPLLPTTSFPAPSQKIDERSSSATRGDRRPRGISSTSVPARREGDCGPVRIRQVHRSTHAQPRLPFRLRAKIGPSADHDLLFDPWRRRRGPRWIFC